jgi:hypothetical protein
MASLQKTHQWQACRFRLKTFLNESGVFFEVPWHVSSEIFKFDTGIKLESPFSAK